MKKIIAAAVTAAFVAPAFAADVTLSGSQEFNYQDNNGTTTAEIDGTVAVGASTQTANGLDVSAVIKYDDAGAADGGASLSIASGDMGKVSLGDVSGAVDAIDDINDWGYEGTTGVGGDDASLLWSLPSIAPNLEHLTSLPALTLLRVVVKTEPTTLLFRSSTQLVQLRSVSVSRRLKVVRKSVLRISRSQWRV